MLEDALRFTFTKLTKDQLVDLAIMLTIEGLHSAGRKPTTYYTYKETRKVTDSDTENRYINNQNLIAYVKPTREAAEAVMTCLTEIFKSFGKITVSDVMECYGKDPTYQDSKFGWTSTSGMYIIRVKDGWQLILPQTKNVL
jgi:hypothetical protein